MAHGSRCSLSEARPFQLSASDVHEGQNISSCEEDNGKGCAMTQPERKLSIITEIIGAICEVVTPDCAQKLRLSAGPLSSSNAIGWKLLRWIVQKELELNIATKSKKNAKKTLAKCVEVLTPLADGHETGLSLARKTLRYASRWSSVAEKAVSAAENYLFGLELVKRNNQDAIYYLNRSCENAGWSIRSTGELAAQISVFRHEKSEHPSEWGRQCAVWNSKAFFYKEMAIKFLEFAVEGTNKTTGEQL